WRCCKTFSILLQNSARDFAQIQVCNGLGPDHLFVIRLVVFRHLLRAVPGQLLPVLPGFFVQVQAQGAQLVKPWLFFWRPFWVWVGGVSGLLESPCKVTFVYLRPVP